MATQRTVGAGGIDFELIKSRALTDVHGDVDPVSVPIAEARIASTAASAVIDQLVGRVVSVEDANRVLAEERDNFSDIAAERDRYRAALERAAAIFEADDERDGLEVFHIKLLIEEALETAPEAHQ